MIWGEKRKLVQLETIQERLEESKDFFYSLDCINFYILYVRKFEGDKMKYILLAIILLISSFVFMGLLYSTNIGNWRFIGLIGSLIIGYIFGSWAFLKEKEKQFVEEQK